MISFIVPTIGRPSLMQTLGSIETRPGDEVLVVGEVRHQRPYGRFNFIPCPRGNDHGGSERNFAMSRASGRYLAFIDDDDTYAPGHRLAMGMAILTTPGKPVIFRMRYPNGVTLWQDQEIRCGNVGTPMILIPNMPTKLGVWSSRYECDFNFLESMKWPKEEVVWRPEIVANVGHCV